MSHKKTVKEVDEDAQTLVLLLKKANLFNDKDEKPLWRIKVNKDEPVNIDFADHKSTDFMGYSFSNKHDNKIYINPPKKLLDMLEKDNKRIVKNKDKILEQENEYGSDVIYGFYNVIDVKKKSIERLEEEIVNDDEPEINHSDMRSLGLRKVAEIALHESNVDTLLGILVPQVQHKLYTTNEHVVEELAEILESIRGEKDKSDWKKDAEKEVEEVKEVVKKEVVEEEDSAELVKLRHDLKKYKKALSDPKYTQEEINKIKKKIEKIEKEIKKLDT